MYMFISSPCGWKATVTRPKLGIEKPFSSHRTSAVLLQKRKISNKINQRSQAKKHNPKCSLLKSRRAITPFWLVPTDPLISALYHYLLFISTSVTTVICKKHMFYLFYPELGKSQNIYSFCSQWKMWKSVDIQLWKIHNNLRTFHLSFQQIHMSRHMELY